MGAELAPWQGPIPKELAICVSDQFSESRIRLALVSGPFKEAVENRQWGAIANALTLCDRYELDPFLEHVYVAQFKRNGPWHAFPSWKGRLAIAERHGDFDGIEEVRQWEDDEYVWWAVNAWRKGRRFPGYGEGYKRKMITWTAEDGVERSRPDPHARRKARSHAIRVAVAEIYSGAMPPLQLEELDFEGDQFESIDVTPTATLRTAGRPDDDPGPRSGADSDAQPSDEPLVSAGHPTSGGGGVAPAPTRDTDPLEAATETVREHLDPQAEDGPDAATAEQDFRARDELLARLDAALEGAEPARRARWLREQIRMRGGDPATGAASLPHAQIREMIDVLEAARTRRASEAAS